MEAERNRAGRGRRPRVVAGWGTLAIGTAITLAVVGGCMTPSPHTISRKYGKRSDVPVDPPGPAPWSEDDCAAGGRLFQYYCGSCHNARPLGERPFSNYHVALTHMRDQAYLTGKEYRQIIYFLRRWHDIGPPTPPVEPSPKRFVFSQPIAELRGDSAGADSAPPPPASSGPWQRGGAAGAGAPPAVRPGATGAVPGPQPGAAGSPPSQSPSSPLPAPLG